jgi:hypothetical protein
MELLMLAEWRRNAEVRQQIVQAAHRQRNEEIGRLFERLFAAIRGRSPKPAKSTSRHVHV